MYTQIPTERERERTNTRKDGQIDRASKKERDIPASDKQSSHAILTPVFTRSSNRSITFSVLTKMLPLLRY